MSGAATAASAPFQLRLPKLIFDRIETALEAALRDGAEHGGIFGPTVLPPHAITVVPVAGDVATPHQIDYAVAWAANRAIARAGTFHTHLWELIDLGGATNPGWAGGAHSDADLARLVEAPQCISIVVAQRLGGGFRIFLALKPRQLRILEGTARFVAGYKARVVEAVKGGADWVEASELELARLGRSGYLVFYAGDSRVLSRLIPPP